MITADPKKFWNLVSQQDASALQYILPGRSKEEFEQEGLDQAKWLQQFIPTRWNLPMMWHP